MIKITVKQLKELNACGAGIEWFKKHRKSELKGLMTALLKDGKFDYARWLLARLMTHPQKVQWGIFSAEQVIDIFEAKYPKDDRPRKAIQAAKDFLDGKITASAAAYAAVNAAYAAVNAAYAAVNAAYAAVNAAYAAAYAAVNAAYAAARKAMERKLVDHALLLLGA